MKVIILTYRPERKTIEQASVAMVTVVKREVCWLGSLGEIRNSDSLVNVTFSITENLQTLSKQTN